MSATDPNASPLQGILTGVAVAAGLLAVTVLGARALVDADRISRDAKLRLDGYSGRSSVLADAGTELRWALAIHPEHAPSWVQLARVARKAAQWNAVDYDPRGARTAHEYARRALEIDPNCRDAMLAEGWTFLLENDPARAADFASRADASGPATPDSHLLWAEIDLKSHRFEPARSHAVAILRGPAGPRQRSDALMDLEEIAVAYGDLATADSCYLAAIALQPANAWIRGNYAQFLLPQRRYDEALAWADSAIAIMNYPNAHRTHAAARYWRAMDWIRKSGRWKEAHAEFQSCVAEDPRCARGWYGIAFVERGRFEQSGSAAYLDASREALRRARAIDPTLADIAALEAVNAGSGGNLLR